MKFDLPRLVTALVMLNAAALGTQYLGTANAPAAAKAANLAQNANPAEQRNRTIDELAAVNKKLDTLITLLQNGNLQVRVATADEKKERAR